ncbi:unnamed protein product, partial [Parnassius apollo]
CESTEYQFLADFVAGKESTAGGRLARWLAPMPRVEPSLCELRVPTLAVRPSTPLTLPIFIRDQYGDAVVSPSLKVEVVVQRLDDNTSRNTTNESRHRVPDVSYQPTVRDAMCFQAITMMKAYQNYSFEELRLYGSSWSEGIAAGESASGGRFPPERLPVHTQIDGSYLATWVPRVPGHYVFKCTLDDQPVAQEVSLEVLKACEDESDDKAVQTVGPDGNVDAEEMESKLRRFAAQCSAGLRVRASPSLQAEEVGRVPPGGIVAFVEEVVNKDGTWVRLSEDSKHAYAYGAVGIAWCLQHHRQLDRVLLVPIEPSETQTEEVAATSSYGNGDAQAEGHSWPKQEETDPTSDGDDTDFEERKFPFSIDICNDSDESSSPFMFGPEPSKRSRIARKASCSMASPRSNGNSNDWWSKLRPSNNVEDANVQETAIVAQSEPRAACRLAQTGTHTGTQTSPDCYAEDALAHMFIRAANVQEESKEENSSPKSVESVARDRIATRARVYTRASPPPLPARGVASTSSATCTAPPRKHALSPAQAECLRAIFAALLWHEGIVHDAIACAAFLKFHPQLPKQGARVLTRDNENLDNADIEPLNSEYPSGKNSALNNEETKYDSDQEPVVSELEPDILTALGQYLSVHPSALETLTRSGTEAWATRDRKSDINEAIKEEDTISADSGSSPSVVSVLPPALRAMVALWDGLCDADQLAVATDKFKKEASEKRDNEDLRSFSGIRKRKDWKQSTLSKTPYSVRCELCGGASVPPPLAAHMRHAHPGCHAPAAAGYDRAGQYRRADASPLPTGSAVHAGLAVPAVPSGSAVPAVPSGSAVPAVPSGSAVPAVPSGSAVPAVPSGSAVPAVPFGSAVPAVPAICGQLAQAYQLWYIYCEKCREKALRNASSLKQTKTKVVAETSSRTEPAADHYVMKENAIFLLDVAPLTNNEGGGGWEAGGSGSRGGRSPPGSAWQPAPPFQCLAALGAEPRPAARTPRYHSLGRPTHAHVTTEQEYKREGREGREVGAGREAVGAQWPRVHRSVSMGQAGGRGLLAADCPPLAYADAPQDADTYSASAGSSLLAQPSAALRRLIGCGDENEGTVSAFEAPKVDLAALFRSPVLNFVLSRRDLNAHRMKMDAAARINTVRQYACEALNWLLRSATQPICVHDVMWWFCESLSQFASSMPPTFVMEDNKEEGQATQREVRWPTAPRTCALCPGGRATRGLRGALHALLGSVSALAPALRPPAAPALQAVRCWALHYAPHDRAFLHRSQVFSVISRILSHGEDGAYEEGVPGALHESFHSYINKDNFVWRCMDVTGWCDITVSSRQGMAGALTDGSTETFWESGDEDRNKAKWIQIACPSSSQEDRPYLVCLHIDNTRDAVSKTLLASFLFSCGSNEMVYMQDSEIDPKSVTWVCYALPRIAGAAIRVRCELRGPEAAVRVRQVRVLSVPTPYSTNSMPTHALQSLVEQDTLRVFRLLTSQVFGKLLEWDHTGTESNDGTVAAEDTIADDSDLREHVVGILFAGHKLTSLQRQVMTHIVCAIRCEAIRVRDDWETALLCADVAEKTERSEQTERTEQPEHAEQVEQIERAEEPPLSPPPQDNYCFEMLSLLLALSGSAVGRAHLAQSIELLTNLLSLLHTGSERVQRQVISLLRRMITEISPQRVSMAINLGVDLEARVSFLDHIVCYLAKAITVQVKVKGSGAPAPGMVTMGTSLIPVTPATWFMRGSTTKKHAHLVSKLLLDMAEDKVSMSWGEETRKALATYASQVAQVSEAERRPDRCIASPTMWLALAALCVCEQSYIDLLQSASASEARIEAESRPLCVNHDDGSTAAVVECHACGALCAECDRFLHLNRAARTHHRQICKEEESAVRIDIHEGCGRAKLFWLLLLVDRRTLKGLAEFRSLDTACDGPSYSGGEGPSTGFAGLAGTCRFCGTRSSSGLLAIGNVCADEQCQEHSRDACTHVLPCGHVCGGVRGESTCLPCLVGCASGEGTIPLRQDADDMCMICFTDPLQAAPAIQLTCGHVFHLNCCKKVLASKWIGPRITFSFSQCPICKEDMNHWTLEELLAPLRLLREEVRRKALMRLQYEGLGDTQGRSVDDPAAYAMERYAYYVCHKCGKAYFGGLARCEAEASGRWDPGELVCGACSDVTGARVCPKHGSDFLEYKCRYCCSVAVFFCFGTSHFCNACHDDFQRVTNIPRHLLPQCPAGPKGEQLPGSSEECPLHVQHPPTGEEFALGCGVCRHAQAF